ncbi:hypothetical protein V7O66_04400 [Methanolobus sp. ZRKC3]|uniref:hypothetical protein n=1 Tax=Methanolobus sp. ZRKC3 TaxID=3125786 RepID=UPI00324BF017
MKDLNKKIILILSLLALVLVSGCVSTETTSDPASPENVSLEITPITIKEFHEQDVSISVINNDEQAIDDVKVTGFSPLSLTGTNSLNAPGKEAGNEAVRLVLNAKITAPAFDTETNESTLTVSYLSGMDEEGHQIVSTGSVPFDVTILPDAKLQFLGFVKDMDSLRTSASQSWELKKGENATISFSVKNEGQTTISAEMLTVVVDVDNKLIADQASMVVGQAMARKGTSYTKGLQIPINDDAPNGETDVTVSLMFGDNVIDQQQLLLTVKL